MAVRVSVSGKQIEEIKRLHLEGKAGTEIAAVVGLHPRTVNRYRRQMGLPDIKKNCSGQRKQGQKNEAAGGGACDGFCDGCVHLTEVHWGGVTRACYYRINTGQKRPCPAGKGCTVKGTGKRKPKLIDPW